MKSEVSQKSKLGGKWGQSCLWIPGKGWSPRGQPLNAAALAGIKGICLRIFRKTSTETKGLEPWVCLCSLLSNSQSPCFALPRQVYKGSKRKPSRCCCFRYVSSCWSLRVEHARPRAAHKGWAGAAPHLSELRYELLRTHSEEK